MTDENAPRIIHCGKWGTAIVPPEVASQVPLTTEQELLIALDEERAALRRQLEQANAKIGELELHHAAHHMPDTSLRPKLRDCEAALAKAEADNERLRRLKGGTDHPEHRCQRCGGRNISSWYADNPLWNEVVEDEGGILCPICFTELAAAKGISPTAWRLSREGDSPEVDMLRAVVDKLPKTADGVVLFPGTTVWAAFRDGVFRGTVCPCMSEPKNGRAWVTFDKPIKLADDIWVHDTEPMVSCLYSTRKAAEEQGEPKP